MQRYYLLDQYGTWHVAVVGEERDTKDGHYIYKAVRQGRTAGRAWQDGAQEAEHGNAVLAGVRGGILRQCALWKGCCPSAGAVA